MIKVAIQTFKDTGHAGRGVGVYGMELINALKKRNDIEVFEFSDVDELDTFKVDLVHFLVFDLFQKTLPNNISVPVVVTVHDVTPLVFGKHYPAGIKGNINLFMQKRALNKVDRVITISENSKKDIEAYLGIKTKKINVVHSGVGEQFKKVEDKRMLETVKKKYQLPDNFAFYSGNVNWNKNIVGMTQACISAGIDLVIVGKSFEQKKDLDHPEMKSYKEFLNEFNNNPKVHVLGFVPDDEMVAVLNLATVSLFVSFYEGFGFPILEAQACEVPVISSKLSAMPEVGGKGAMYVDPYDVDEMTYKIQLVVRDEKLRKDLIAEGKDNVEKFSWQKCADETVGVYSKLLK